jgi:hypothetical protein
MSLNQKMRISKYIVTLIFLMSTLFLQAQTLRNEGLMNVSGGYLVIKGNYQNESAGSITLDGKITVSGNWTNNGSTNVIDNPDTNGEVVFNGTGTQIIGGTADEFDFEKLTINSGSNTQVEAGKGITAYGACTFTNPLVLKASTAINAFHPLIATFINNSTVSGNITMELPYTSTGNSTAASGRSLYFSSPISNSTAAIFNVGAGSNLLWYQNEVTRQYVKVTVNSDALSVGKGYIFRSASSNAYNFTGTPNTASSYSKTNIPRVADGHYYLFGNPYPAAINWDLVSKTNLSSTIWYQTCTTAGASIVDTWNEDSKIGTNNNGIAQVTGKVPPMQSFWIQCSSVGSTGSLTLDASQRTHNQGTTTVLKSGQVEDKNIMRLNLFTGDVKDEAVIVESSSAEDAFDKWDSKKFLLRDGKRAEVYSLSPDKNNKNLVIQSVKPIVADKLIRLGIYTGAAGSYKFVADLSGSTRTDNVFLEDTRLKTMQDLFVQPEYSFTSEAVEDTSRFILHILRAPTLKVKSQVSACSPGSADLTASEVTLGSDAGLTFTYWLDQAASISFKTPSSAGVGTYFIKGTVQSGAYSIMGPIEVVSNPSPSIVINNPAEVTEPATVDLTAFEITEGSTNGLLYTYWTDASATISYNTPQFATQGQYYLKGTVESTGCYAIGGPVQVTIASNTTGINSDKPLSPVIYANGNQVYIRDCAINSYIYIFDMLGRQQYQSVLNSDNEVIETGLKTGNYLVKVVKGKSISLKKIFISNGYN